MMKVNPQAVEIPRYISSFLTDYAPSHLTGSEHTVRSYETALTLYIGFLEQKGITAGDLTCKVFEHKIIEDWLKWLSDERGCSAETCNNRLAALRAFIRYLSSRDVNYLYLLNDSKTVPLRKTKKKKVSGLTKDAVKLLLSLPDMTKKAGIRDETLMVILYGTATRLDEVLSLRIKDLHIDGKKPYITVMGKGGNTRALYLLPKAVSHLQNYLNVFFENDRNPNHYVFFSRNKGTDGKLSQAAVHKMLKKYAVTAHEKDPNVPIDLHAHQFRHARASHWLEEGINIVQISRLLGHAQLETTMVYLDITTEQEAMALATLEDEKTKKAVPKWNPDKDTLSSLCGLRKLSK